MISANKSMTVLEVGGGRGKEARAGPQMAWSQCFGG